MFVGGDESGSVVEFADAVMASAYPHDVRVHGVGEQRVKLIACQSGVLLSERTELLSVETVQAVKGSDPHETVIILPDTADAVTAETVPVVEVEYMVLLRRFQRQRKQGKKNRRESYDCSHG